MIDAVGLRSRTSVTGHAFPERKSSVPYIAKKLRDIRDDAEIVRM